MSFTATIFPIIAALAAPEGSYFKQENNWCTVNEKQAYFIEHFFSKKPELAKLSAQELRTWVSPDAAYLTDIAQQNGFGGIQFAPFQEDEFGVLSILDVAVQWVDAGVVKTVDYGNKTYKAAQLENNFMVFEVEQHAYPIAKIKTQSNDVVYMTIADEVAEEFVLLQKVSKLQNAVAATQPTYYDYVQFPHVALDQKVNISWLLDMQCPDIKDGGAWKIIKAMQQTKFNMDEKGARVQSAVGMVFSKECCSQGLVIDKPFYIWIERPGCSIPVFAGYIDSEHWVAAE